MNLLQAVLRLINEVVKLRREVAVMKEAFDQNALSSHHIYSYLRQPDKLNFAIAGVGYQRSDGQYVYKYLEQIK